MKAPQIRGHQFPILNRTFCQYFRRNGLDGGTLRLMQPAALWSRAACLNALVVPPALLRLGEGTIRLSFTLFALPACHSTPLPSHNTPKTSLVPDDVPSTSKILFTVVNPNCRSPLKLVELLSRCLRTSASPCCAPSNRTTVAARTVSDIDDLLSQYSTSS